jgi:hypothetical protein
VATPVSGETYIRRFVVTSDAAELSNGRKEDAMIPAAALTNLSVLEIPRTEIRAVVERISATQAQLGNTELAIGVRMLEAVASVTIDAASDATRDDLWHLRPTWAWVWLAELADAPSWARVVRWARQVAERHEDPAPLARCLGRFASRHGEMEARARLARATGTVTERS